MSLPGTEVLRIVERGSRDAQRFAELTSAESEGAQRASVDALERRGTALLELARHYLPSLDDTAIVARFAAVREQIDALRAVREDRLRALRTEVEGAEAACHDLEEQVVATTRRLEELVAARDERQAEAARILAADAAFQELANEAGRAENRLERDEARAVELAQEAAEKLPEFERSRLFRYLVERGFGTAGYRARGFVRRMDRWVARLVGFEQARASYDHLRSMPELVAAEVARRKEELAETMARIDAARRDVEARVGLAELVAEGERQGAERDRLVDALDAAHDGAAAARAAIAEIEGQRGGFHADALQQLRDHLDRLGTHELEAHARATAEPVDDRLVAEIAAATRDLDAQRVRIETLTARREAAVGRARALQDVAQRLRRSNFDSLRSLFDGIAAVDLERRLQRIAEGVESPEGLWKDLSARQRFERPSLPDARGGTPWPSDAGVGAAPAGRAQARGGDGEFPWWVVHALGAVVDVGLRAAAGRGIARHGGSGRGRSSGGSRSTGGGARGGFTRGAGF